MWCDRSGVVTCCENVMNDGVLANTDGERRDGNKRSTTALGCVVGVVQQQDGALNVSHVRSKFSQQAPKQLADNQVSAKHRPRTYLIALVYRIFDKNGKTQRKRPSRCGRCRLRYSHSIPIACTQSGARLTCPDNTSNTPPTPMATPYDSRSLIA